MTNTIPPLEWQCACGAWISKAYLRHPHIKTAEPSVDQLVAARMAGNENPDLDGATEITYGLWSPASPIRPVSP